MLSNKKITALFILFLVVIFLFPHLALAQDIFGADDLSDAGVNLGTRDLVGTIARIINIFLGFLGTLATLIILYGGYIWMTSGGSAEKVDKAKKIIINGVIGLAIILSSYIIARFIFQSLDGSFSGGDTSGGGPSGYSGGVGLSGGVLDSHYPARNATGVPRNTNIYVTFREDMDVSTIVDGDGSCTIPCDAHLNNIRVYIDGTEDYITGHQLLVTYDPTNPRVFGFNPYGDDLVNHLGSETENVRYRVDLGGLYTAAGNVAFPLSGGYSWRFTVSTDLDLTPPRVTSVRPHHNSSDNPRNSVVQINFSEAVNPLFAVGEYPPFINISVSTGGNPVDGVYVISNQYRTVEFMTNDECGTNSCGGDVYCLPASADFVGAVTDSIQDMAGNELDCQPNCNEAGVGEDNYGWSFSTNNQIDLTPPFITEMESVNNVDLRDPIRVTFSKELLSSSINTNSVDLVPTLGELINYWMRIDNNEDGTSILRIHHDPFEYNTQYTPNLNAHIKDTRQNCWFPCRCEDPINSSCVCDGSPPCSGPSCVGS